VPLAEVEARRPLASSGLGRGACTPAKELERELACDGPGCALRERDAVRHLERQDVLRAQRLGHLALLGLLRLEAAQNVRRLDDEAPEAPALDNAVGEAAYHRAAGDELRLVVASNGGGARRAALAPREARADTRRARLVIDVVGHVVLIVAVVR
jgi:hypothetical protein